MMLFSICFKNKNIMAEKDKEFLEYLNDNFPNYENEWLFDLLYSLVVKYELSKDL